MTGHPTLSGSGGPSGGASRRGVRNRVRLVLGAHLVSAALVGGTAVSAATDHPHPARRPVHSSDGSPGPLASPVPLARLTATSATDLERYRVVPGLHYRHWLQTNERGTVHAYLLRVNLQKPGLSLEYAGAEHVSERAPLTTLLDTDAAVAGVNADFFDITDTGAPRGVGVDDGRVIHGPRGGWTTGFSVTGSSQARIGRTRVKAVVVGRPGIRITNLNSPQVPVDGIGLYTPRWGDAPGYAVTDGALRRHVRQVVVRRGRVVSNTRSVSTGSSIEGRILLGRGAGAVDLAQRLPVGSRVRIAVTATREPRVAVGGSEVLVAGGEVVTTDDRELHPRTAVGIDSDTERVLLVVIDGRSEASSGYTLVELAQLMVQLGAERALNLDGGGSSTMAVTPPDGTLTVANTPSDGQERLIPEAIQLVWSDPAG